MSAALGFGHLNVATDGGGSIRIPSGFCGVFGIKPTFSLVPVHPHSPAGSLWNQGPITRTVTDAALMLTVMAQPDPRDWQAGPARNIDYRDGLEGGVRGLRIAYSRTLGYAKVEPAVAEQVDKAVRVFSDLGAQVEEIDLKLEDPIAIMRPLWSVALAMAVASLTADQRALMDPPLLDMAEPGFHLSALEYRQLERARDAFARRMNMLHLQHDLLVTPQLAVTVFEAGHNVPPGGRSKYWWEWSPFTYPFNLSQQPAAAVPCGFVNGMPVALQVVGVRFAEALVLRAARAFETARPFVLPHVE